MTNWRRHVRFLTQFGSAVCIAAVKGDCLNLISYSNTLLAANL